MKLSVIIVNYNCHDKILGCLESLKNLRNKNSDYEVIVVDNHSTDKSPEMIKVNASWVKLIQNDSNLGFAKGNNKGLRLAQGKYILFLNPDTEIPQGAIETMLEFMENNPETGASTCRVELADQRLDPACHRGFPTPWASFSYFFKLERLFPKSKTFGKYHMTWCQLDEPHEIDSPSGCFFLVRKSVLDKVGSFDEDYFLYGEDVDLAYRIKQAGFKILFYPKVKIIHYKGVSSGIKVTTSKVSKAKKDTRSLAVNAFYDAMWLFYQKHLRKKYPFFIGWLVYLGIWIKHRLSLLSQRV